MGKKSAPKAPDMTAMATASEKAAELGYKTSEEQLQWSRDMWGETKDLLGPTLDVQRKIMDNNYQNALEDRSRYEQQYLPLEKNLVEEFQQYDTEERRAKESGEAMAQVRTANEAARERSAQQLEGYGIEPGQVRAAALDRNLQTLQVAQEAAAGNKARKSVQDTGRALRAEAINIGRGMPSQVAQSYGTSLQAGNSTMANQFGAVNSGTNSMGTGLQWGANGLNATGQQANIVNTGFQNKLAAYEAQGNPMELLATGVGAAAGMMAGMNEGGEVAPHLDDGTPQGRDSVDVSLTPGEYVLPKEAVSFYGTDKIDKMVQKARQVQGIPEPQLSALPAPRTSLRMNDGGSIDAELAAMYARNQAMAVDASTFRTDLNAKREASSAQTQKALQQGAMIGKKAKEAYKDRADKARAARGEGPLPTGVTGTYAPAGTMSGPGLQPSGATVTEAPAAQWLAPAVPAVPPVALAGSPTDFYTSLA